MQPGGTLAQGMLASRATEVFDRVALLFRPLRIQLVFPAGPGYYHKVLSKSTGPSEPGCQILLSSKIPLDIHDGKLITIKIWRNILFSGKSTRIGYNVEVTTEQLADHLFTAKEFLKEKKSVFNKALECYL